MMEIPLYDKSYYTKFYVPIEDMSISHIEDMIYLYEEILMYSENETVRIYRDALILELKKRREI